ncbi:MAG: DinB family protein [Gemmatimonadales bacterium]
MTDTTTREMLARALAWHDAHADFDGAVKGIPARDRGTVPPGVPYSAWQLVEHLRIAQHDILEFCVADEYHERQWPDDYWPKTPGPPSDAAWERSLAAVRKDCDGLQKLALDASIDLDAKVPNGNGQTWLRELLLAIDHNAYHVGQLVLVRRLLGDWGG